MLCSKESSALEDEIIRTAASMGTRRPQQGEAFWGEIATASRKNGIGLLRFCRDKRVAVRTFNVWSEKPSGSGKSSGTALSDCRCGIYRVGNEWSADAPGAGRRTASNWRVGSAPLLLAQRRFRLAEFNALLEGVKIPVQSRTALCS